MVQPRRRLHISRPDTHCPIFPASATHELGRPLDFGAPHPGAIEEAMQIGADVCRGGFSQKHTECALHNNNSTFHFRTGGHALVRTTEGRCSTRVHLSQFPLQPGGIPGNGPSDFPAQEWIADGQHKPRPKAVRGPLPERLVPATESRMTHASRERTIGAVCDS